MKVSSDAVESGFVDASDGRRVRVTVHRSRGSKKEHVEYSISDPDPELAHTVRLPIYLIDR
jgi:hypothetical protein